MSNEIGRELKVGDVIQCHGSFDYIRVVILLHKKGYELECGETKNSIVIMGVPNDKTGKANI